MTNGCADEFAQRHPFGEGWRYATVRQVDGLLPPSSWPGDDCRTQAQSSTQHVAELQFLDHNHLRRRIVAVPADLALAAGDRVYVDIADCAVPVAPLPRP